MKNEWIGGNQLSIGTKVESKPIGMEAIRSKPNHARNIKKKLRNWWHKHLSRLSMQQAKPGVLIVRLYKEQLDFNSLPVSCARYFHLHKAKS